MSDSTGRGYSFSYCPSTAFRKPGCIVHRAYKPATTSKDTKATSKLGLIFRRDFSSVANEGAEAGARANLGGATRISSSGIGNVLVGGAGAAGDETILVDAGARLTAPSVAWASGDRRVVAGGNCDLACIRLAGVG